MTTVRRAGPVDAADLSDLAGATFALACPPRMRAESIAAFVRDVLSPSRFEGYLADPSRELLLAELDDRPVGYAMVVLSDPEDMDVVRAVARRPTAELSKIYVREESHGGGAASALMAECLRVAREAGAAGMWLGVNQQNERAQRFYRRAGFEVVGTKRFQVGEQVEDDFVMERAL